MTASEYHARAGAASDYSASVCALQGFGTLGRRWMNLSSCYRRWCHRGASRPMSCVALVVIGGAFPPRAQRKKAGRSRASEGSCPGVVRGVVCLGAAPPGSWRRPLAAHSGRLPTSAAPPARARRCMRAPPSSTAAARATWATTTAPLERCAGALAFVPHGSGRIAVTSTDV